MIFPYKKNLTKKLAIGPIEGSIFASYLELQVLSFFLSSFSPENMSKKNNIGWKKKKVFIFPFFSFFLNSCFLFRFFRFCSMYNFFTFLFGVSFWMLRTFEEVRTNTPKRGVGSFCFVTFLFISFPPYYFLPLFSTCLGEKSARKGDGWGLDGCRGF